jgi:hypothetical protein
MMPRLLARAILAFLVPQGIAAGPAAACTPSPGWRSPAPQNAFRAADTVIHARIVSRTVPAPGRYQARIKVIRVLKGSFDGDTVFTVSAAACGLADARFQAGKEHVFFLYGDSHFVSRLWQPSETTEQTLDALRTLRKQGRMRQSGV